MNITNLNQVNKLVKIKERCINALDKLADFAESANEVSSSDDLYGYDAGYNVALCSNNDGSGPGADMTGCYVGREMAVATRDILENQIRRIDVDLSNLGVIFE